MAPHSLAACIRATSTAGILALTATSAAASSFALIEQSVSGMGTAYAIGAAGIDDASTLFFNPAGMSRLPGTNLSAGAQIVKSDVDIDASTVYSAAAGPAAGFPVLDTGTGNPFSSTDTDLLAAVPSGYITHQSRENLWFGLGINAHFGLETDYDDTWVGRYHSTKSELVTIDFNPSIALKPNDMTTVAFGVSALYADGKLKSIKDGGLASGSPGAADITATLSGDDWGFGFNAGVLLEPTDSTRIGMHYRSRIKLDIEGDIVLNPPAAPKRGAKLPITLPESLSLSGYHSLNQTWAVMADVTWTRWSRVQNVDVSISDGAQDNSKWDYDNSLRYAIGAEYRHSPAWILRAGLALDKTPVPNDTLRSPRVPDADRTWLTLGASYQHSPAVKVDFGYAHLFVDDPKLEGVLDANDPAQAPIGFHAITGSYDASVDIVGVQVNWKLN